MLKQEQIRFHVLYASYLKQVQRCLPTDRTLELIIAQLLGQAKRQSAKTRQSN